MTAIVISLIIVTQSSHLAASNHDPMSGNFRNFLVLVGFLQASFDRGLIQWCVLVNQSVEVDCEDHNVPPVRFLEPKRSFLDSPRERRCSCAVDFWHIVVQPRRRKTTRTYYCVWKSRWNNELRCIGFWWLRSPISINQESEDNIELLPLYHVPCVTFCTLSLSCQTTLTKRQKKKKKRLSDVSVPPWKLTQVSSLSESHTSHGRARHQIRD